MEQEAAAVTAALKLLLARCLAQTGSLTGNPVHFLNRMAESDFSATVSTASDITASRADRVALETERLMKEAIADVIRLARQVAGVAEDGSYGPGLTVTPVEPEPDR